MTAVPLPAPIDCRDGVTAFRYLLEFNVLA